MTSIGWSTPMLSSVIVPGLILGFVVAHFGSGVIASQLFGVAGLDGATYLVSAAMGVDDGDGGRAKPRPGARVASMFRSR